MSFLANHTAPLETPNSPLAPRSQLTPKSPLAPQSALAS